MAPRMKASTKLGAIHHPNLAEAYRRRVVEFEGLLRDPELRVSRSAIWSMIERIVVAPRDGGRVRFELHGDLARVLRVCAANTKTPSLVEAGFPISLVAGA